MLVPAKKIITTIVIATTCFTAAAQDKQPYVTHITYKGSMFEVLKTPGDTAEMLDLVTNEVELVITNPNPVPVKYNNMNIYSKGDVEKKAGVTGDVVKRTILQALAKYIAKFADGEYRILLSNIIINDKGKVVYYNFDGFEKMSVQQTYTAGSKPEPNKVQGKVFERAKWTTVYEEQLVDMTKTVEAAVDKLPAGAAASVKGYPVPYRIPDDDTKQSFPVRKGVIINK